MIYGVNNLIWECDDICFGRRYPAAHGEKATLARGHAGALSRGHVPANAGVLNETEDRTYFVREAVERELERREAAQRRGARGKRRRS